MIVTGGFAYSGRTFASLSEIASLITGTKWNGPKFFGLRPRESERTDPNAARTRRRSLDAKAD
jgi:hypothetical protein